MKNVLSVFSLIFMMFVFSNCNTDKKEIENASLSITEEGIKPEIAELSSDNFLGRGPASLGEERTISYLETQFKKLGLLPGNGVSYFQEVPLFQAYSDSNMQIQAFNSNKKMSLKFKKDLVVGTSRAVEKISVPKSEMIFAGYGITSPEYNWDDYKDLDVKGKTVVVLVNDPGYATGDTSLFTGKAMTYYGRWTYKYEEAARHGAAGVLIIHEDGAAGYPWSVVQNSWSGDRFYFDTPDKNMSNCEFNGWINNDVARKLFELSGLNFDELTAAASKRGFKPVNMNLNFSINFKNKIEYKKSHNVIAYIPGSERPNEYIIYTAHWDHFGVNKALKGDNIMNGALDNATGVAGLLELAKAYKSLSKPQKRSIIFLSITCEEFGLMGSEYYTKHPTFPLNKTVADINMDALNIFGKMKDITVIGYGNSELDNLAAEVAKDNGRYVVPDPTPENGNYFRSDHFSFARAGVPAIYFSKGVDNTEHGKAWTLAESAKWTREHYHKPSDEFHPELWKFDGMIDDLRILFEFGYKLSMSDKFPNWNSKSSYKILRDEMMK